MEDSYAVILSHWGGCGSISGPGGAPCKLIAQTQSVPLEYISIRVEESPIQDQLPFKTRALLAPATI